MLKNKIVEETAKGSNELFNSSFGQFNSSVGQFNSSSVELEISGMDLLDTSGVQLNDSVSENAAVEQSKVGDKVVEDILQETEDNIPNETPHTDPDWLDKMKGNFHKLIAQCSGRTQKAVKNNEIIKVLTFAFHSQSINFYFRAVKTTEM